MCFSSFSTAKAAVFFITAQKAPKGKEFFRRRAPAGKKEPESAALHALSFRKVCDKIEKDPEKIFFLL
ncbi:MAG: hypothetical protein SPG04_07780 [Candidatus Heritagella sp.]|nr:hypothetical protein [Candidatus Heritagella sp.]